MLTKGRASKIREAALNKAFKDHCTRAPVVRSPGRPGNLDDFRAFYLHVARIVYGDDAVYPDYLQDLVVFMLGHSGEQMVCDVPPRHLKTTTILMCIIYIVLTETGTKQALYTYQDGQAGENAQQYDALWRAWCGNIDPGAVRKKSYRGNYVYFGSILGGLTGKGFNRNAILDDPLKNREDAFSQSTKDAVWSSFTSGFLTRIEKDTCNVLVNGTRWVSDDPQGRCLAQGDYKHLHFPAINAAGEPLCAALHSLEFLLKRQKALGGPRSYDWLALYQGTPPDIKLGVFVRNIVRQKPRDPLARIVKRSYGMDLAYTQGSSSDYCAFASVVLWTDGTVDVDGFVCHAQVAAFMSLVKGMLHEDGAPVCWYTNHTEMAFAPEITAMHKVRVSPRKSKGKLGNAQHLADGWNNGTVRIPLDWQDDMTGATPLGQILQFTGRDNGHDDYVDALAVAYDDATGRGGEVVPLPMIKTKGRAYS